MIGLIAAAVVTMVEFIARHRMKRRSFAWIVSYLILGLAGAVLFILGADSAISPNQEQSLVIDGLVGGW